MSGSLLGVGVTEGSVPYDLDMASTEDVLTLEAFTSADTLRPASLGLAVPIVP